jgi:hypothetical protein
MITCRICGSIHYLTKRYDQNGYEIWLCIDCLNSGKADEYLGKVVNDGKRVD